MFYTVASVVIVLFSFVTSVRAVTCGNVTAFTDGTSPGDGWYCGEHFVQGGTTYCNYWSTGTDQFQGTECNLGQTSGTCVRSEHSPGLDSCTNEGTCADLPSGVYCGSDSRVNGVKHFRYYCDSGLAKPMYARPCAGSNNYCISTGAGNDYCAF